MPAFDRLVSIVSPSQAGTDVTGGITGTAVPITRWTLTQLRSPDDIRIHARSSPQAASTVGKTAQTSGIWEVGSRLAWVVQASNTEGACTLTRPIDWSMTASTYLVYSLRSGFALGGATLINPTATDPEWDQLRGHSDGRFGRVASDPRALDISGVLVSGTQATSKVWARLVSEEYVNDTIPGVDASGTVRVTGRSTWLTREGANVLPFATLTDDDTVWTIIGVRNLGRARRYLELTAERSYED